MCHQGQCVLDRTGITRVLRIVINIAKGHSFSINSFRLKMKFYIILLDKHSQPGIVLNII